MKRVFIICIVVSVAAHLTTTTAMQQPQTSATLIASAKHKATVDGDLKAAIELYKRAVAAAGNDRAIAAEALVAMAECYQKLGDSEARRIYEEILNRYPDQKSAAAVARERLGRNAAASSSGRGDRIVWAGTDVDMFGRISPDGRYLTFVDWANGGTLMLRDLTTNRSRPLTSRDNGAAQFSIFSRDGAQIAFEWRPAGASAYQLYMAPFNANDRLSSRPIGSGVSGTPLDWSPDGKTIAVLVERDGGTALGLVGLDGSVKILKSAPWRGLNRAAFSPDGRFLAYDVGADDDSRRRAVRIIAIDASRDVLAAAADGGSSTVLGWSADGHVLFSSDRSGARALWAVAVADGKPGGAPRIIRSDLSSDWSLGFTPSGTLYLWKYRGATYVSVAPVDLTRGQLAGAPTLQRFVDSRGRPRWSDDGRHLMYVSCGPNGGGPCTISIWDSVTNATVDVPHSLWYLDFPIASPDGRKILARGSNLKGRVGIHLIDMDRNTTTLLIPNETANQLALVEWTPDGRGFLFAATRDRSRSLIQRDLESGAERVVSPLPACRGSLIALSPDRKQLGCLVADSDGGTALIVVPLAGGSEKALMRAEPGVLLRRWAWLPDGSGIMVGKLVRDSYEIWLASLDGPARKLGIDPGKWVEGGNFQIHPDGRQLAFVANAGEPGGEVWALENVVPKPNAKK